MRLLKLLLVCTILLVPVPLLAQSVTGTVRDDSGAVLPGVTVEAASPALIEQSKSAVTDGTGQYRIVDLRPGTYVLTFTLPGFTTVRREGLQLTGTQTLTIPADMRVGGVQETITVTGETPVVDVKNARREMVIQSETIQTLPLTRAAGALLNITPGLNVSNAGTSLSPSMTSFNARSSTINAGSVGGEGRYMVNGFPLTAARSGGFTDLVYDTVNADEVTVRVGGGLGETDIGGPLMNVVPRSGGNAFSGTAFLSTAGEWSSGDNLSDEIQALNPRLQTSGGVIKAYDWSASLGGPIKRNRLWFFGSYRRLSTMTPMDGIQENANAGDASRWDWIGAPTEARLIQSRHMYIGRLTGQAGKSRLRYNYEYQNRCEGTPLHVGVEGCNRRGDDWVGLGNNQGSPQMSPEATSTAGRGYFDVPFYINQGTWTMPATNRLLFEAGMQSYITKPIFGHPPPDGITSLVPVTEQSNAINPVTNLPYAPVANYRYRAVESWGPAESAAYDVLASTSYVTGAHSAKVGYQLRYLDLLDRDVANGTQLGYRFNRGVPNAVSYYLPDFGRRGVTINNSVYAQDSWTRGRLTLQGALRWDRVNSYAPAEKNGTLSTSFLNPQPITILKTTGVDAYNDISPRAGLALDLLGNGKTALKFNWGRYLAYAANNGEYTATNPGATVVRNVLNRGWNASVAAGGNGDFVVDCDLLNAAANGECAAASSTQANFGKLGAQTIVDPDVLEGWGVRAHDYQYTFTVQQQLFPSVSFDGAFTHRTFHGFFNTTDLSKHAGGVLSGSPAGWYEAYTLQAPADPRLAGGGGYDVTVYAPTAAANAVAAVPFLFRERDLGAQRDSHWDGFELTVNARLRGGLTAQVGSSTGRGAVNTCETITRYAPTAATNTGSAGPDPRGCHNVEPWQSTIRGLASYTLPRIDVLISTTIRSQPEEAITATWQVPNAVIATALGHLPAGATATGTTNLLLTDNDHRAYSGRRRTQLDMRFAKVLRFNRTRTDIGIDLNNLLNTNYTTGFNTTYIYGTDDTPRPTGWGTPTSIYPPRFARFNVTVSF